MAKVITKELDKKTKGPLLLELVFNIRSLPVISTVPIVEDMVVPTMLIKASNTITFERSVNAMVEDNIDIQ